MVIWKMFPGVNGNGSYSTVELLHVLLLKTNVISLKIDTSASHNVDGCPAEFTQSSLQSEGVLFLKHIFFHHETLFSNKKGN